VPLQYAADTLLRTGEPWEAASVRRRAEVPHLGPRAGSRAVATTKGQITGRHAHLRGCLPSVAWVQLRAITAQPFITPLWRVLLWRGARERCTPPARRGKNGGVGLSVKAVQFLRRLSGMSEVIGYGVAATCSSFVLIRSYHAPCGQHCGRPARVHVIRLAAGARLYRPEHSSAALRDGTCRRASCTIFVCSLPVQRVRQTWWCWQRRRRCLSCGSPPPRP
jgi:hypothetical protein